MAGLWAGVVEGVEAAAGEEEEEEGRRGRRWRRLFSLRRWRGRDSPARQAEDGSDCLFRSESFFPGETIDKRKENLVKRLRSDSSSMSTDEASRVPAERGRSGWRQDSSTALEGWARGTRRRTFAWAHEGTRGTRIPSLRACNAERHCHHRGHRNLCSAWRTAGREHHQAGSSRELMSASPVRAGGAFGKTPACCRSGRHLKKGMP